ncbi:MAG: isoleucine--tRNA ligase [Nanoarchaeota archaeon]
MNISNSQTEKEILAFWEEKRIFQKLREKNKGKKKWSFIDGPITANNPMGVHHAWGRTYKDLYQRFKAMQGYDQRYQNGFDCQGLWIEREEEKERGLKNKSDIEKFGILNFVNACKARVEKFSKVQRDQSIRLGQWMDWDNSYYTMTDNNNLHNWHLIKKYHNNGWLYKGKDSVPWCPRCGTASSKHDIATEGYKEVTHTSLYMKFPVKGEENTYFLIFTTTPWTVPVNVAIALNKELEYVKVENEGSKYWIAESRLSELKGEYKIIEKKKGSELKGKEYLMPYANLEIQKTSPHKVLLWELASGEEGTGIVHIAPGCGSEDFDLGKREKLTPISPLNEDGTYTNGFEEFSTKKYYEVNKMVLGDLEERKFIYKKQQIKHRYPHCWRCGEELVFRLVDEWYVSCKEIRKKLITANKKIKWYPEYGKVRQETWFENMGDWLISRKRYWGLPLPIWECECGHTEVVGSLEELKEKAINKKKVDELPEIHRPWIDEIKIKCEKCGKESERIKDVGDAWLDAGIVMFSTLNYLKDKKYWGEWYPADFITENMPGQQRGWFNAIMWAGITLSEKAPFKTILGYESLRDEKGEEMHKSKGNAIWFDDAAEKIGADPMRMLYMLQDPGQELKFGYGALKEPQNNLNILYNLGKLVENSPKGELRIEDKWIMSKFSTLTEKVTEELENLHPHLAMRALQNFWLNDLSRGYIQMIRERLSENDLAAKTVIKEIYLGLLKLLSPIIPFTTERVWQELRERKTVSEESVHLCDWPKSNPKLVDIGLEGRFENIMTIIEAGMRERDRAQIGLKWPLKTLDITAKFNIDEEMIEVIKRQLNVKEVVAEKEKNSEELSLQFDTKMTPILEAEGFAREISRGVQAERKKTGLVKTDIINLEVVVPEKLAKNIVKFEKSIKERTNAKEIEISDEKSIKKEYVEIKIKNNSFYLYIKKI